MKISRIIAAALLTMPAVAHAQETTDCGCYKGANPAVATGIGSDAKVLLRLNLPVGRRDLQRITVDQRTTTVSGKTKFSLNQTIRMDVATEVLSVTPEGNLTIRYTFGNTSLALDIPSNGDKAFEKSRPQAIAATRKVAEPVFAALRGQSVETTVNPQGRILSFSGMKEMLSAMLKAVPGQTAAQKAQMAQTLQATVQQMTDKENATLKVSMPLPDRPLGIGESWIDARSVKQPLFALAMTSFHTLIGRADGVSTVSSTIQMKSSDAKLSAAAGLPPSTRLGLSGSGKGVAEIDESTGLAKRVDTTINMVTRVDVTKGGKRDPAASTIAYSAVHTVVETVPVT